MQGRLIAFAVVAIAACAPRSASVVGDAPVVEEKAAPGAITSMPAEIGTFKLGETRRFPDPTLGILYRYRNDSRLRPDVYVYPVEAPASGSGPVNPAREEGMNFGYVLRVQQSRRAFDSFEIVEQGARTYDAGSSTIDGWHVHARLMRRNQALDSHLHVYVIGDQMLKVRTTFAPGSVAETDLEAFVTALLQSVTRSTGRGKIP